MKLATICPPKNIAQLPYQSGYQMALAQMVLTDMDYSIHIEMQAARGSFIILDNGAAENEPLGINDLYRASVLVRADEIVLPDKLRDGPKTLEMHTDSKVLSVIPPHKRMVVVQGRTWPEVRNFVKELDKISDWFKYASIGIPKHLEALKGGRAKAIKFILEKGLERNHHIHLLGVYAKPFEEALRAYEAYRLIRGIDTAAPVAYAQRQVRISDLLHYSLDWNLEAVKPHMFKNIVIYSTFLFKGLPNELKVFRSPVRTVSPGQTTIRILEGSKIV